MRPRIAITVGPAEVAESDARRTYRDAVERAGGETALLYEEFDAQRLRRRLAEFDGLLVPGGHDIDPALYGGSPHPTVTLVAPELDAMELEAARIARQTGLPTLGICRGIQVLNVALGGSIYEDIDDQYDAPSGLRVRHKQTPDFHRSEPTHDVDVTYGSRLAGVLGGVCVRTNSTHHQALRRVAFDLVVVGKARDGVVEAVELREPHPFFVGVQWHPEEMVGRDEPSRRLFGEFVKCAAERAAARATA